jgi:hypothetical protein
MHCVAPNVCLTGVVRHIISCVEYITSSIYFSKYEVFGGLALNHTYPLPSQAHSALQPSVRSTFQRSLSAVDHAQGHIGSPGPTTRWFEDGPHRRPHRNRSCS